MKILPLNKFTAQDYPIIDRYETVEVTKEHNGQTYTVQEQQPVYKQGVIDITQEELDGIIVRTHCFNETLTAVVPYVLTQEEEAEKQKRENEAKITALKKQLTDWDYKTSKYADGEYTEGEWAAIAAERKALRKQIQQLEAQSNA